MSLQTLIIQRRDEQAGQPLVVVEMLTGDTARIKAVIPMSPILMDSCKGLSKRICSGTVWLQSLVFSTARAGILVLLCSFGPPNGLLLSLISRLPRRTGGLLITLIVKQNSS